MSSAPLVSVVLTSYNQGRWLRESVESVFAQTFADWELVLVDNGSTDESRGIVAEYAANPKVVAIQHDRNIPHTVISNEAIRRARGSFISFLYSDDFYLPNKLAVQVTAAQKLDPTYGVVYSSSYRQAPDGSRTLITCGSSSGNVLAALLDRHFFEPITPLVRRECLLRYPFTEKVFMEGEGIFTKLAMGYSFFPAPEAVAVMRDHDANMGKEITPNLKRNVILLEELFAHPDFPRELSHLRNRSIARQYRLAGWQKVRRERSYADGREWLWQSVRHRKTMLVDARVAAGLFVSSLPAPVANGCIALLDRVFGAPPPPVSGPPTPVEGRRS